MALIEDLPECFLVLNGDVLTTLKYDWLYSYHLQSNAAMTIACHRCNTQIDLGIIEFDGRLHVTDYREKPSLTYDVSMGVYVFDKSVLNQFSRGDAIDFPTVVKTLVREKLPVKVYLSDDEWLDIGRPEDYRRAAEQFAALRDKFLPDEQQAHVFDYSK